MRHGVAVWLYQCSQSQCDIVLAILCVVIPVLAWLVALMVVPMLRRGNGNGR
jgi:hypothetical protein